MIFFFSRNEKSILLYLITGMNRMAMKTFVYLPHLSYSIKSILQYINFALCMRLYNHFTMGSIWHKVCFVLFFFYRSKLRWFEFRVFLLLDWLPKQGSRIQSALLFTHSWGRADELMYFLKALMLNETQTASSRFWTWITDYISYNNNRYTKYSSFRLRSMWLCSCFV